MRPVPTRFSASFGGYTAVALFLLATLALAGWIGYQAFDAAAAERRTAEAVLQDYAGIAAAEFARYSRTSLDDVLEEVFEDAPRRSREETDSWNSENVPRYLANAARAEGCRCPSLRSPLAVFRIDSTGVPTVEGLATLSPQTLGELQRLTSVGTSSTGRTYRGLAMAPQGAVADEPVAVGFLTYHNGEGELTGGFGFILPVAAIGELLEEWYGERRLLPTPIAEGEPNDSVLHVSAEDPSGNLLFASPMSYPTDLSASSGLGSQLGDITILAAIRPDAASQLVIGGLPTSRLPLLAVLLLLTLGVGIAAVVQLRQEQRFQELREDFVSGVSHELRTPLAQIRIFAELQESGRLTSEEDRERAISVIHRESRRLSHLVENILQFSRLRRNPVQGMPREDLDLGEALADGIDAVTPLLHERGMTLEVKAPSGLIVSANRDALTRIMVNLLDNAVKYGPDGQTVRVEARRHEGSIRVIVSDEGPGVPTSERERVWKPYRRLERDIHARIPGTGIGLSVVSELVALHGGSCEVENSIAGGARFTIEFPAVSARARSHLTAPIST